MSLNSDTTCVTTSVIPVIIVYGLIGFYCCCVLITSIRSFIVLKRSNDNWVKLGCCRKFIMWIKDIWRRKKCYLEIFPHIFDQATDIGVIIAFYSISVAQQNDSDICSELNMTAAFWVSVAIMIIYRIMSSIQIYVYTKSHRQLIFQLLDIEFLHALMVNYKSKKSHNSGGNDPCQPQLWISMMEATFESAPQAMVQFVYLWLSGLLISSFGVVHISFIWSILTIVLRTSEDDKNIFANALSDKLKARLREDNISKNEWKSEPSRWFILFPLRLIDISNRIFVLGFCYIYMQWYIFVAVNAFEIVVLLVISIKIKRFDRLNHYVRCELDWRFIAERIVIHLVFSAVYLYASFSHYKDFSVLAKIIYFLFVLVPFVGPNLLVSAIFYIIHKKIKWFNMMNMKYFNKIEMFHSSRNIDHLIDSRHWSDILDLILFGFNTTPNEMVEKNPNLLNLVSEDFESGEQFLNYLMGGLELNIDKFQEIWCGTIQAIENKQNEQKQGIMTKIFSHKKQVNVDIKDEKEFDKMINFLQTILENDVCAENMDKMLNATTSHHERTILHILVTKRRGKKFLDQIIEHKALDPNIYDKFNETPLHIATNCKEDNISIGLTHSLLRNNNIEINVSNISSHHETPLHYSIKNESPNICDLFLKHDRINIDQLTETGDTYLLYAAQQNNEDIALMVVNNDTLCDINAQNHTCGDTTLHVSVSKPRLFQTLMTKFNNEIDVNVHNLQGVVCLMNAAAYYDNNICLDLLLQHNTLDINAVDINGNSTLHRIVTKDKILNNFNKVLSHKFINVNLQNNTNIGGFSALHLAYFNENQKATRRFNMETRKFEKMSNGCDRTMYDKMRLLLNHWNINVNLQALGTGDTALHGAVLLNKYESCINRRDKLILLLSQPNINKHIRNFNNQTPSIICIKQVNDAKKELEKAERELSRLQQQLIELEQQLERKKSNYQHEQSKYNQEYSEYKYKKKAWEQHRDAESRWHSNQCQGTPPTKPTFSEPSWAPSTSNVDRAKEEMKRAQSDRDSKEYDVNRQQDTVRSCRETVKTATEINNILQQY